MRTLVPWRGGEAGSSCLPPVLASDSLHLVCHPWDQTNPLLPLPACLPAWPEPAARLLLSAPQPTPPPKLTLVLCRRVKPSLLSLSYDVCVCVCACFPVEGVDVPKGSLLSKAPPPFPPRSVRQLPHPAPFTSIPPLGLHHPYGSPPQSHEVRNALHPATIFPVSSIALKTTARILITQVRRSTHVSTHSAS